MRKIKEELNASSLSDTKLDGISGGYVVDDGDGKKYCLVRQIGTVISPVPSVDKAQEFARAYGISATVLTREEYKHKFGRELVW